VSVSKRVMICPRIYLMCSQETEPK